MCKFKSLLRHFLKSASPTFVSKISVSLRHYVDSIILTISVYCYLKIMSISCLLIYKEKREFYIQSLMNRNIDVVVVKNRASNADRLPSYQRIEATLSYGTLSDLSRPKSSSV